MATDVMAWFTQWLTRHPLKTPPGSMQEAYTREVMTRVTDATPAPVVRWVPRPRLAFAVGTALACGLAVMAWFPREPVRVAERVEGSVQVLAELGELNGPLAGGLEDEAILVDRLVLAKTQDAVADEAWIDDTIGLLNEVDETAVEASNGESLEELLRELESLDESEIASS